MKLTKMLKDRLVALKVATADATDDEFRKAAAAALADGQLTLDELTKLTADADADKADSLEAKLQAILDSQKATGERLAKLEGARLSGSVTTLPGGGADLDKAFAGGTDDADDDGDAGTKGAGNVRVKGAHEQYDTARKTAYFPERNTKGQPHPFAGQRAFEGGDKGRRYLDEPSELEKAVNGAYIKWAIASEMGGERRVPAQLRMTDHDKQLIDFALHEMKWGGVIGGDGSEADGAMGIKGTKLSAFQRKALIDDSTSGGLEAAPIAFDDMVILTPLLNGEFFPRVNVVNITRGRRIEGASMGNVTFSSGGADDTAIPLFNTANFVAAFDTNIYVANGSIEIGLDFLSDTPIPVAETITSIYGQQLLTWLDTQICVGDGTTEPEGVTVTSGTTTVNAENGASGPPTVGDYESLLFGVAKAYKQGYPADRIVFGGTETSYQRARGIAVGSSDQRRVFGMTHEDYMLFGHPYGINEDLTNRQIFFANLARYRMYRRLGLTLKVTTEGKELVRNNLMLITARARFGGSLEDGAAAAYCADAQS